MAVKNINLTMAQVFINFNYCKRNKEILPLCELNFYTTITLDKNQKKNGVVKIVFIHDLDMSLQNI